MKPSTFESKVPKSKVQLEGYIMELASNFTRSAPVLRSHTSPLSDDQIRSVAPSIFALGGHERTSARYSYIPTSTVLTKLRSEGFQPFQVAQTRVRDESRREFTKHMLRLRHEGQENDTEANEIILLNSHDGSSSFQLLAGVFRFVCTNGLVVGDIFRDIRVKHTGNVADNVIEGAYEVLDNFGQVKEHKEEMKLLTTTVGEREAFARAALALKYDDGKAPITEAQVLQPRRSEDNQSDLWSTFNRVQENLTKGGLSGRSKNGRRQATRPVRSIDTDVRLNRGLWTLAEEFKKLKAA